MKILLVLLYLWNGSLKLDTIPMRDYETCLVQGKIIVEKQSKDPRFEEGLFGICIDMPTNMKVTS